MSFPTRSRDELLAVCRFLRTFPCPWWLGGGWAIDAWIGSQSRDHEDIEICVARHNQGLIYSYCATWDFLTPVNDQWAPLPSGTWLAAPQFMLQLQQTLHTTIAEAGMPPTFEFLLNEVDGERIAALIDWEEAALGDPRIDSCWLASAIRHHDTSLADQFIHRYEEQVGYAVGDLQCGRHC